MDKENNSKATTGKEKQEDFEVAVNPNPRANENIKEVTETTKGKDHQNQVGSEITDGEAG